MPIIDFHNGWFPLTRFLIGHEQRKHAVVRCVVHEEKGLVISIPQSAIDNGLVLISKDFEDEIEFAGLGAKL